MHGEGEEFILIGRGVHREEGDEVYYSLSNKKRGKVGPFSTPIFFYVQNAGGRHATTQQHSTTQKKSKGLCTKSLNGSIKRNSFMRKIILFFLKMLWLSKRFIHR